MRHPLDEVSLTPHPASRSTPSFIARRLRETGVIVFDGLTSRQDVLALASGVMAVAAHPDSDPDGVTTIRDTRRHASRPGFTGLTSQALAMHTERSGVPTPPRLMLLACERPADQGGECLLTDARAVHADLVTDQGEAARWLTEPRTVFFGAGDGAGGGHATQVFTGYPGGRLEVRLRLDALARWSPLVQPHVAALRDTLIRHQRSIRLTAGQACLLDNTRWLHGRTAFTGDRVCWRVLGDPKFALPVGFIPDPLHDTEIV